MSKKSKVKKGSSPSFARNAVSIIFSFILMLMLTLLGLLVIVRVAATSGFISRSCDPIYAAYVKAYVEDAAIDYTLPTSIDISVAEDLFTEDKIHQDSLKAVRAAFNRTEFSPDIKKFKEELSERVNNYFESSGTAAGGQTVEITNAYVDEIMDIYVDVFDIPGLSAIAEMIHQYGWYLWIAIVVVAAFSVVLIILCVKLHHWPHRGLRYVAYSTGSAFLVTLAAPLTAYISSFYTRIQITPQYVYYLLTTYVQHVLEACFIAAGFWLAVTVVLMAVIGHRRKQAMNKMKSR